MYALGSFQCEDSREEKCENNMPLWKNNSRIILGMLVAENKPPYDFQLGFVF